MVFSSFVIECGCSFVCVSWLGFAKLPNLWINGFHQNRDIFYHYFFAYFSAPLLFRGDATHINPFDIVPQISEALLFFKIFFSMSFCLDFYQSAVRLIGPVFCHFQFVQRPTSEIFISYTKLDFQFWNLYWFFKRF